MKLQDTLETVAWGEEHFGSVTTGGPLRKRDVDAAIRKGLVVEVGAVTLCDGDGFTIHPERYRTGYKLTEAGRRQVRPNDQAHPTAAEREVERKKDNRI